MKFPIIETSGSPYEVGFQHGRQAAEMVPATYRRFCRCEIGDAAARDALLPVVEATVAGRRPEALEEIRGIADGAGMAYEQIRDLNFSIELWNETFLLPPTARGCTLVALADTPEGVLISKTMDVGQGDEAYVLVQRVRPADGFRFVHVTYAGTIWTDGGVNEAGLAEVNSSLETRARNLQGFPVFFMTRDLLQCCANVKEATRRATDADAVNYGSNILLADESGDRAVVERTATRHAVRRTWSGAGPLFATNHSLTPELEDVLGGSETLLANSRERFDRLTTLCDSFPSSLEGFQNLYRDHTRPGGFCQHGQGDLHTVAAFIASPRARQLWVARGSPCENPFEPIPLERS